jgi:very-short-patch-repair endonuclease
MLHVAVPPTASRLRSPDDRRRRLRPGGAIVLWSDDGDGPDRWRVSVRAALAAVLVSQPRDVAVACFSLALNRKAVSWSVVDEIFAGAPARVQRWRPLLSDRDESHGETYYRLWTTDAGIACEQQVTIDGVGRLDFRVAAHTYVEIDGGQHDPAWTGGTTSSWSDDLDRAAALAIRGDRVLHFGYRQLYGSWATVLAAVERAIADDAALTARRRRHPYRAVVRRKRRRSAGKAPP